MRTLTTGVLAVAVAAAVGCGDLATPSELARPQVLAVRADPPGLAEGARAELSILLAGPDGLIDDAQVAWAVAEPTPELPAIGEVEIDGEGRVWYVPPPVIGTPMLTSVQATATVGPDTVLVALKGIGIGLPLSTANPTVDDLLIDGQSIEDGDTVELDVGATVELDVLATPPPTDNYIISWYATIGEIELYRRAPTELIAPDEAGSGVLYVVYRDDRGGVAWRSCELVVE